MKHLWIEGESKVREHEYWLFIRAHAVDELKKSKKAHEYVLGPKKDRDKFKNSNKTKPNVSCYVCGKSGHYARYCRPRKGQKNEADATNAGDY